jgi:predicted XRE-type DNA-binding protein
MVKNKMTYKQVTDKIKEQIEAAGLKTQQEIAEATGVNQAYISMLMNDKVLPRNQLEKLLRHFNLQFPMIIPWIFE